jgi:plasmid stabilization system protein ParE
MELVLLTRFDADTQDAFNWLEDQSQGRGVTFLAQLDHELSLLKAHPRLGRYFAAPYRRKIVRKFPYGIIYAIEGNRLILIRVASNRANLGEVRRRLRARDWR